MGKVIVRYVFADAEENVGFTSKTVVALIIDTDIGMMHVLEVDGEETHVQMSNVASITVNGVEITYV